MTKYQDIIKSFNKEDYEKVNLHIHTNFSDGKGDAETIVKEAKELGYKYIAISDHNTVEAYRQTNIFNEDFVIPAVEFDVWCGYVFMHLLAYGIDIEHPEMQAFYAKTKRETEVDIIRIFSQRNIKKLIKAIHNAGGIAVLAHPCCCWALNLERFVGKLAKLGLDGIEVYYPYPRHRGIIKFSSRHDVAKIADKYNLIKTGGTDLHSEHFPA